MAARLRELSNCEKANVVTSLQWLSRTAPRLTLAENDVKRAELANRIIHVATCLENALGCFRGSFHTALVGGAARTAFTEFVLAVRTTRIRFDHVKALKP